MKPAAVIAATITLTGITMSLLAAAPAAAQDGVAAFYRGRSVALQVGSEAGGQYDVIARTVARHLGRHIPGQPTIVVQNVTGAGGLKLLNQLYAVGARDGTVIGAGISGTPTGALLTPGVAKFDPRHFGWLGSAGIDTFLVVTTDKARVRTLEELYSNELIIGGSASGSASVDFPTVANAILGTKFKIISGYPAASAIVKLAMPAGEVEGCSVYTLSSLKSLHERDWKEGRIRIFAQWGTKINPEIADVPIFPLGKTEADRQLFELLYARQNYGRPYMVPPGVPPARLAALRGAFAAVFGDPVFRAEAEKLKLDLSHIGADEINALTERVMATPPAVVARIQSLLPGGGQ
jgi:tripartite-type tricarboxylate transporter receptor subunit TctC